MAGRSRGVCHSTCQAAVGYLRVRQRPHMLRGTGRYGAIVCSSTQRLRQEWAEQETSRDLPSCSGALVWHPCLQKHQLQLRQ